MSKRERKSLLRAARGRLVRLIRDAGQVHRELLVVQGHRRICAIDSLRSNDANNVSTDVQGQPAPAGDPHNIMGKSRTPGEQAQDRNGMGTS